MQLPTVLFSLALAGAAAAQGQPQLPECAKECANKALTGGIGDCGTNPACICANKKFIGSISCCLAGVCDAPAQSSAVVYASSLCAGFGVTNLPTAVVCSTATAPTTTGPGTASASTTGATSSGTISASVTPSSNSSSNSTSGTAASVSPSRSASQTANLGPRQTAAAGALGAIGGIVAAVVLL